LSKNVAVFVDVANLYYSARGQEVDVDYVALLKAATKGRDLIRAYAYSGLDPENENQRKFIDFLGKNGYKVVHKDIRKFGDGRVKANLDIELVVDLFRLAKRMDIAVIVSGDGDFAPAIRALQDEGVRCEVISFRPNTSSDLIAVADEFIDIMKVIGIGRGRKPGESMAATIAAKGMSAPEMPAKEVVPEFGFREASPSVAAAALAALREGKEPRATGRTRGGRGRTRPEPAVEEVAQPVAAAAVPEGTAEPAAEGEEGRRRRRRRGGRGRGRGRSGEANGAPVAATPEATGEIGWTELDDVSQINELAGVGPLTDEQGAERPYTFEEADEATLAELGLLEAGEAAAAPASPEAAVQEAAEPAPRRRGRTRKAAAPEVAETSEAAEPAEPAGPAATLESAAAKPARRRSRAKKPETGEEQPAPAAAAEEEKPARRARSPRAAAKPARGAGKAASDEPDAKPARRRSRTSKAAEAAAAGGESSTEGSADEETQGIWQRFRSARGGGSGS
jgi:uncharacterized LabA/DUF88 family protein